MSIAALEQVGLLTSLASYFDHQFSDIKMIAIVIGLLSSVVDNVPMVAALQSWISKLEEMATYLNGTGPESVQSKLKNGIPDTLFDKIRVAETKKIARVAMELTSLNEMLKGYLASSGDSKFRGV
jgi:hypothetical protein